MAAWRTAFIVRVAMIEGPALFCVVGLFLEEQRVFLVSFIVLTAFQALNYPSKNRVIDDLQISDADLEEN